MSDIERCFSQQEHDDHGWVEHKDGQQLNHHCPGVQTPDFSVDDEDPIEGGPVPCVMCGMAPQRGGTGCCSQVCLDALHEAYPTEMRWDSDEAVAWLLDLRARLERGEEPTERDKVIMGMIVESMRPIIDALAALLTDLAKVAAGAILDAWNALPEEIRAGFERAAAREETSQRRGGLGKGISALITQQNPVPFESRVLNQDATRIRPDLLR